MSEDTRDYGPTRFSHTVLVEVKPGATNDVVIGGTGRTVTGKLECSGPSGQEVDWRLYAQTLRPVSRTPSVVRPRIPAPNATPEERQRMNEEYLRASEEANRKQRMLYNITYVLVCEANGTFRVPNLPPGDYNLNAYAVISSGSNSYRHIGNLSRTVTVPEGTTPLIWVKSSSKATNNGVLSPFLRNRRSRETQGVDGTNLSLYFIPTCR